MLKLGSGGWIDRLALHALYILLLLRYLERCCRYRINCSQAWPTTRWLQIHLNLKRVQPVHYTVGSATYGACICCNFFSCQLSYDSCGDFIVMIYAVFIRCFLSHSSLRSQIDGIIVIIFVPSNLVCLLRIDIKGRLVTTASIP